MFQTTNQLIIHVSPFNHPNIWENKIDVPNHQPVIQ